MRSILLITVQGLAYLISDTATHTNSTLSLHLLFRVEQFNGLLAFFSSLIYFKSVSAFPSVSPCRSLLRFETVLEGLGTTVE